jgi:phage N-6-adenine-methyltransferase
MKGQETLFSSKSDDHGTPQWLFDKLLIEYNFTLDPAASAENAKCAIYFTEEENGLVQSWANHRVFINPPYSGTKLWVEKAIYEVEHNDCQLVVMLLPSRTGMKWFTEGVLKHYKKLIFIQGRLKFVGQDNSAPFDSIIVVFEKNNFDHDIEVWSNKAC